MTTLIQNRNPNLRMVTRFYDGHGVHGDTEEEILLGWLFHECGEPIAILSPYGHRPLIREPTPTGASFVHLKDVKTGELFDVGGVLVTEDFLNTEGEVCVAKMKALQCEVQRKKAHESGTVCWLPGWASDAPFRC